MPDERQTTGDANDLDDAAQENTSPPADAADQFHSAAADDAGRLAEQLREAQERVLRAQAELENYRKRSRRELDDTLRYAALPLMRDVIGVIDNLERAIESAEQSSTGEGLLEGVKMVAQQLKGVLAARDCRPIESLGLPFDPNKHEAIAQEASDEYPAGVVTRVAQLGYQLHDRVVRPSQVLVSTGPPAKPAAGE